MAKKNPKRFSTSTITIDGNVRCQRVYPVEGSKRSVDQLKTVAIKLTKEQAIHLARVLLAASQEWDEIDVTAFRFQTRKSDGTHIVTVTTPGPGSSKVAS